LSHDWPTVGVWREGEEGGREKKEGGRGRREERKDRGRDNEREGGRDKGREGQRDKGREGQREAGGIVEISECAFVPRRRRRDEDRCCTQGVKVPLSVLPPAVSPAQISFSPPRHIPPSLSAFSAAAPVLF